MNRFNNVIFGQKAFVINDKNEVLVLKRSQGEVYMDLWDVPGGKLEDGNDLLSALAREIKEESGLELTRVVLVLSTSKFQGNAADAPVVFRNIYLVQAKGHVKLSEEHSEYRWVKAAELPNLNFPPDADFQSVLLKIPEVMQGMDLNRKYSLLF